MRARAQAKSWQAPAMAANEAITSWPSGGSTGNRKRAA